MVMSSMPNVPGAAAVTDTLEFMKSLWGGAKMPGISMPGMVMPTLSVDEINKQIADLKAVESWLTVNMNMLHGTIKALEVQSATIATLQSMSASFAAAIKPAPTKSVVPSDAPPPFESPCRQTAAAVTQPEPPEPPESSAATESAATPTPMANPAAWWTMLQDQFKQAVASATVPVMRASQSGKASPAKKTAKSPRAPAMPKARNTASKAAGGKPAAAKRKAASGR